MLPRVALVYHHFIAMIPVEIAITRRQHPVVHPYVIVIVNVLVVSHVIISVNIRHIIIVSVGVSYRAPFRLTANV